MRFSHAVRGCCKRGKIMPRSALAVASLLLGGCASTASFAPPYVNLTHKMNAVAPRAKESLPSCRPVLATPEEALTPSMAGAGQLIDNYVYAYRCAAHSAGDGRQYFEVPAFLALIGASTAVAFGAGPDVAIAGTAASSVLNGGKAYYAPKDKAEILDYALDALLCIKTESVGIDPIDVAKADAKAAAAKSQFTLSGGRGDPDQLFVSASVRYYNLITAALLSVERVMAHRLSNAGSYDPAGVVAEIERANQKIRNGGNDPEETGGSVNNGNDADGKTNEQGGTVGKPGGGQKALGTGGKRPGLDSLSLPGSAATAKPPSQSTFIDLDVLKPKLDKCVVRAKL